VSENLSQFCIYTILHTETLNKFFHDGGDGEAKENTTWKEGQRLFLEAQKKGLQMPIVFAAADVEGGLLYSAILKGVQVDEDESSTTYKFTDMKPLADKPSRSSLTLKSSGKSLSEDYIRPYAICYTPSFINL
jgi:hypothetical protein